jgi:hypothetical protein
MALARQLGLPLWTMLTGPHGEFELVFTIPPAQNDAFLKASNQIGFNPISLGTVTSDAQVTFTHGSRKHLLDTGIIRDLFHQMDGDITRCISKLLKLNQLWNPQ